MALPGPPHNEFSQERLKLQEVDVMESFWQRHGRIRRHDGSVVLAAGHKEADEESR